MRPGQCVCSVFDTKGIPALSLTASRFFMYSLLSFSLSLSLSVSPPPTIPGTHYKPLRGYVFTPGHSPASFD